MKSTQMVPVDSVNIKCFYFNFKIGSVETDFSGKADFIYVKHPRTSNGPPTCKVVWGQSMWESNAVSLEWILTNEWSCRKFSPRHLFHPIDVCLEPQNFCKSSPLAPIFDKFGHHWISPRGIKDKDLMLLATETVHWSPLNLQRVTNYTKKKTKLNSVAWVRQRTIPSDRRLSSKLVPTFVDRGCHLVGVTDPYRSILGFLYRSRYFFFQVAPQLCSGGLVDPVPDPLVLRNSGGLLQR
jgi:hypothetical protein